MSIGARLDPLLAYNFQVSLIDAQATSAGAVTSIALSPVVANPLAGFNECSGLDATLDVEKYEEGGNNGTVLLFPKRHKYGEITLRRGAAVNHDLFHWFYNVSQGVVLRKDGVITLLDARHRPHTAWGFRRGLPVKFSAPTFNAQQNAVAIESITIAHEGLYLLDGASGLAAAVGGVVDAIGDLF
ncbi:MAG TPA: phage tail protein [Tahibacter sp.]|uniref:phage tail protein n=1 Tax=Tahibacter sp. TaxID=2056211 RepID=UPI002CA65C63|nr:phage tail protein [Tahibacter sp.]HSX63067.1 phage tail protein [Tahibacter sp.]